MKLVGADISSFSVGGRVYLPGPDGVFEVPAVDAHAAIAAGLPLAGVPGSDVVAQADSEETPVRGSRRGRR